MELEDPHEMGTTWRNDPYWGLVVVPYDYRWMFFWEEHGEMRLRYPETPERVAMWVTLKLTDGV